MCISVLKNCFFLLVNLSSIDQIDNMIITNIKTVNNFHSREVIFLSYAYGDRKEIKNVLHIQGIYFNFY